MTSPELVYPDATLSETRATLNRLQGAMRGVLSGKDDVIDLLLVGLLGAGHVLVEDVPGVGKTTLAKALSRALAVTFTRVQFTPDLLPTDILGSQILNPRDGTLSFHRGPIFTNILLGDEINRASPRTQSALLEAMNEAQATVDGVSHVLPTPFFVIATQNPSDYQGTYPLPEAQLDRFLLRIGVGYPSSEAELAMLYARRTVEPLAKAAGLRTMVVFGGVGYGNQTAALRGGVDIVIACPGRLEDLVNQRACDLSGIEVTVLDEADHMADLGFLPVVRRLLRATPKVGQRLLFSATLDNGISVLVKEFLSDPILHAVDDETSPVEAMEHHIFAVDAGNRAQVIRELAQGGGRRLLFTRTKHSAKKWAAQLTKNGIPAVDLHGNLSQNARERNLAAFSAGSAKVLVATDIAARGIHVDGIELVVHLDPPTEHKAYLHRSGRTARAGAGGTVITVMLPEQRDDLRKLMKQAGISAATVAVAPGHPAIARLAG